MPALIRDLRGQAAFQRDVIAPALHMQPGQLEGLGGLVPRHVDVGALDDRGRRILVVELNNAGLARQARPEFRHAAFGEGSVDPAGELDIRGRRQRGQPGQQQNVLDRRSLGENFRPVGSRALAVQIALELPGSLRAFKTGEEPAAAILRPVEGGIEPVEGRPLALVGVHEDELGVGELRPVEGIEDALGIDDELEQRPDDVGDRRGSFGGNPRHRRMQRGTDCFAAAPVRRPQRRGPARS